MAKDNVDVVEAAWEAFGRGDVERAAEFLGTLSESFEDFKAVPEKILGADDDHVIVIAHASGRTKAGNPFDGRGVWVYRLQDGKLTEAEFFGDTARALEALGRA